MRSVGELGNVAAAEYPWRTLYLQHPERPSNSSSQLVVSEISHPVTGRRVKAVDWVLADLFRTSNENTRSGGANINLRSEKLSGEHSIVDTLFLGAPIGAPATGLSNGPQLLSNDMVLRLSTETGSNSVSTVPNRRSPSVVTTDNSPVRPFFQIGELAPVLSRLFSSSMLHPQEVGAGGTSISTVTYSVLRSQPENNTDNNANFRSDMHVEQPFRSVSNSITTRGNVFRVLYVGQSLREVNGEPIVFGEYLAEAFVERVATFSANAARPETTDSSFQTISQRAVME
jgi:hypothetical protein